MGLESHRAQSDEIPQSLEPLLLGMKAHIEMLQHVVVFLCARAAPSRDLAAYLETLNFPAVVEGHPDGTKAMHEAIDRFIGELSRRYGVGNE